MASGEIRLVPTMPCQMPVLAQSQSGSFNDPNLFSPQTAANQSLQEITVTGSISTPPSLLPLTPFFDLEPFSATNAVSFSPYTFFSKPDAPSFALGGVLVGAAASLPISYYALNSIAAAGELSLDAVVLPMSIGGWSAAAGGGVGLAVFGLYWMLANPPASPYGPHGPAAPISMP